MGPRPTGDVRFGFRSRHMQCNGDVRFAPESDRESRRPQRIMSALTPKADECIALVYVG